MIGLFDSGLGGLTVVRRLRERLPDADLVFFADQAHVPYGPRTAEDLHHLIQQNLQWLETRDLDAIVMACNTSCAIADSYGWPATRAPIFDLLDSAATAVREVHPRSLAVIATAATVRTGAYGRRLREALPGCSVVEVAAPALVPLVEAGEIEGPIPRAAVADVCAQFSDVEAVVLACTHYPVLDAHFEAVLGPSVRRLDPAMVHAERVATFLAERYVAPGTGSTEYVTNGDAELFRRNVARLTNSAITLVP